MEKNNINSGAINNNLFKYICSFCNEGDPIVFYFGNNNSINLICIGCINETDKLEKGKIQSMDKLKSLIDENYKTLNMKWESFLNNNNERLKAVKNELTEISNSKQTNEIDYLRNFLETFLDEIRDFQNHELKNLNESKDNKLKIAMTIDSKVNLLKDKFQKCTMSSETNNVKEYYENYFDIIEMNNVKYEENFDQNLNSVNKLLNDFPFENNSKVLSKDKKLKIDYNLIFELKECSTKLKSIYHKIVATYIKHIDKDTNHKSNYSDEKVQDQLKYPNLIDLHPIGILNKSKEFNSGSDKEKYNVKPSFNEFNLISNNNTSDNPFNNINNNKMIVDNDNNYSKDNTAIVSDNNLKAKINNSSGSEIYNESYKYLLYLNLMQKQNQIKLLIFETSTGKQIERNAFNLIIDNKKELLNDCRYINTGEGIFISGGLDKNKNESKSCYILLLQAFENSNDSNVVLVHDYPSLLEGRRRHNLCFLKSDLFDNDKIQKSIIICLGGFRTKSCEFSILDNASCWKKLPDLNFTRSNATTLVMNSSIYIFGGFLVTEDKKEEYLNSVEFMTLKDIAYYNSSFSNLKSWKTINLSSNMILAKSAFAVLRHPDFQNKVIICGGFAGSSSDDTYLAEVFNDKEWDIKPLKSKLPEKSLFLNSSFVLGENGLFYCYNFSGKLLTCMKENNEYNFLVVGN